MKNLRSICPPFPKPTPHKKKKKKLKGTYYISFRMSYVLILAFMDITLKQRIYLGNGILQFSSNLCKLQDMNYTIQLLKIQHWCYKIQLYKKKKKPQTQLTIVFLRFTPGLFRMLKSY